MSIINVPKSRKLRGGTLVTAIMALVSLMWSPLQAVAGAQDYRFELSGPPVQAGKATVVKVTLIHVPDGTPVSGAVIIQTRFDMGPDGMASMTAPAKIVSSADPGVYRVETEPSMGGTWALSLSAKVQGETQTVRGSVIVPVPK